MGYNLQGVIGVSGPIGVTGSYGGMVGPQGMTGSIGIVGPKGQTGTVGFGGEDWLRLLEEEKRKKLLEDRKLKIFKLQSKWEK